MADRAIKVAVLEGYFASLSALGFPMPLTLQLQQSDLRLHAAMWRAQSSKAGFSVSFFWPVANPPDPAAGLNNLKKKKRRTKRRKAKAGSIVEVVSLQAKSANSESGSPSIPIDANHDGPHSDTKSQQSEEPLDQPTAIDLEECTDVMYEKKDDVHGVKYVCGESDGWTPVVGKRKKYKVPTCLIKSRAPPHICANLPSTSDSSDSDSSGSNCSLNIPAGANVHYSKRGGKPGLQITSNSTATWTPISSRTRSKLKTNTCS